MRIAVVGGGIAGLAAAWEARDDAEVTVVEPGPIGGKIRTTRFGDRPVDEGADAFITRSPAAVELCEELGLRDELVAPAAGRTLLWYRGRLRPLPDGLVLGVPRRISPILRSGLLSPLGAVRAGMDLVLPRSTLGSDESVADLVGRRFGAQVATRMVEPLVGGIHAAGIADLSAAATIPQVLAAARRRRSLLLALRSQAPGPGTELPLFLTPRLGVGRLVEALAGALRAAGVGFVAAQATSLQARGDATVLDGEAYDGVILAVPAPDAARLLADAAPSALGAIRYTSVTLTTLAYEHLDAPAGVNGILVPPAEDRLMTACSFGSSKWPHWSVPGRQVVRVSVGRQGDARADTLGETELVERVAAELGAALGTGALPSEARVSRWPGSFPQYRTGHPARVADITATLARRMPGVVLAGSSYAGAGIPACIASGRAAARTLVGR